MSELEMTGNVPANGNGEEEIKRIDLSNAEAIRCELMSRRSEMQVTIRPDGIQFNQNCINRLQDYNYIQLLVDSERRLLVVRPCDEDDKDSQRWTTPRGRSRKVINQSRSF